jgi:hypothetical protein
MNRVSHTIRLKVLGLTCLWATCVTCSGHNWWPFLVSLNSSHFDLSNNISDVVIEVLMCLQYHFLFTIFFVLFFYWILCLSNPRCHLWLFKIYCFSKYFLYFLYIYIYILKNSMALASIFGEYIFRALASLSFDES